MPPSVGQVHYIMPTLFKRLRLYAKPISQTRCYWQWPVDISSLACGCSVANAAAAAAAGVLPVRYVCFDEAKPLRYMDPEAVRTSNLKYINQMWNKCFWHFICIHAGEWNLKKAIRDAILTCARKPTWVSYRNDLHKIFRVGRTMTRWTIWN